MLRLYIQAPFAAFRTFTAGWYRPTAGFLTPSAAYGLALNLAGIETRRDDGISPMTLTRFNLPPARIALGAVPADPGRPKQIHPPVHSLFQQLHTYPVGASGKERQADARGNKYNITPVRREFLSDLRAFVCLDFFNNPEVEVSIRRALSGDSIEPSGRYGLPFLGDNAFLIDRIEPQAEPVEALWYRRVENEKEGGMIPRSTRLTIWIDRFDMSKTTSAIFAPDTDPSLDDSDPTWSAWTTIRPPAEAVSASKSKTRGKKG